jgi:subtilisin family serine protease
MFKIKGILFSLALMVTVSANATTTRYVLKNNKDTSKIAGLKIVDEFSMGENTYTIVELNNSSTLFGQSLLSLGTGSESVAVDLPITVDTVEAEEVAAPTQAWHVSHLQYSSIPEGRKGQDVIVAVLDTGVDYNHPALKNHILINTQEIPNNKIDDDNNGYVDDVVGWDFDGKDNNPSDDYGHGTHCAGIIASDVDPVTQAQGVAPNAKIMPIRIIGSDSKGFLSNAAKGVKYAVDNGAKILSNSWRVYRSWQAYDPSDANIALLREAIEYAGSRGVLFVAATGNESRNIPVENPTDLIVPVGLDDLGNMIGVAATTSRDLLAGFSNYGAPYTHVAAPGDNIISTVPGGRFSSMSGTSMATPLVAGALARGMSKGYSAEVAFAHLIETSKVFDAMSGKVVAGGRVDLIQFLQ